jgi:hypothetical protein
MRLEETKMLRWAATMVEVRRGRRAAVAMIAPLVERSRARLNGIPDTAWRDPYLVGFMLTLITIVARIESRTLQDRELSVVQSQAWGAITDMNADLIGEDALTLSTSHPREFQYGCHRATIVASHLCGTAAVTSVGYEPWQDATNERGASTLLNPVAGNWTDAFDTYIAALPSAQLS